MNQKKPRKKSKKSSNFSPNRKLINIFLIIFLIAFLATIASYFTIKNKDSIKDTPVEIKTDTAKLQEPKKDIISDKVNDIKAFKEDSSNEYFEEKFNIDEKHKFEEYTKEFEKVIVEKADNEETINKENEIVQKKWQ